MLLASGNFGRLAVVAVLCSALTVLTGCKCDSHGCKEAIEAKPSLDINVTSSNAIETFPGGTLQMTFVVSLSGGPASAVLTATGLPAGVDATFSPRTVTDGMSSVMTLTASPGTAVGLMTFNVTATESGTNYGLNSTRSFAGTIKPAFLLQLSGGTTVTAGTSGDYVVSVNRAPGFVAPVALSLVPLSVPVGSGVVFSPASTTSDRSDLRITFPDSARASFMLVKVAGASGASVDTAMLSVRLFDQPVPPEIFLTMTPGTATIAPGQSVNFRAQNARTLGSPSGNIILSVSGVPAGATARFTPDSVGVSTSEMVISTTTAIADGSYPLTVTATLGALVKTSTATLVVATPPDFTLSMTPAALTIARNGSAQSTLGIQRTGPVTGVTIDAVSLPAGVTMTTNPAAITGLSTALTFNVNNTTVPGTYPIIIRGTAGALIRTTTLSLTIPAPPPTAVTVQVVTPDVSVPSGGTIKIPIKLTRTAAAVGQLLELRLTGIPIGGNAWISPSFTLADTATLYVIGGTPGTSRITVTAVIGAFPPTDVANVTITPSTTPDFAVVPAPQTLNMSTGSFVPMAIEIWRRNGFTAPVAFSASGDIAGQYSFRFSLTQTTGTGIGFDIYAAPGVPEGPHLITIRGTSGSTVREVTMTIVVSASTPSYPYPYYPFGIKPPP